MALPIDEFANIIRTGVKDFGGRLSNLRRAGRSVDLPRVVMFSGYGGAGKDAAGDFLVAKHGYKRLAFSDPIADRLLRDNPMIGSRPARDIVNDIGFTEAKKGVPGFRQAMIDIGNTMKAEDPDILMNMAKQRIKADPSSKWVVTGPRTTNEMRLTDEFPGSATIRVERPGVGPAINTRTNLPDPTETELANYPFQHRIHNTGTLQDLHSRVEQTITPRRESLARRVARMRGSRGGYIDDPERLDPINFRKIRSSGRRGR